MVYYMLKAPLATSEMNCQSDWRQPGWYDRVNVERRKAHGRDLLDRYGSPMMSKTKADLLRECAIRMKQMGIKKAYVINYTFPKDAKYWIVMQSWYVYEDHGEYFFKMYDEKTKTFHKIEGVS